MQHSLSRWDDCRGDSHHEHFSSTADRQALMSLIAFGCKNEFVQYSVSQVRYATQTVRHVQLSSPNLPPPQFLLNPSRHHPHAVPRLRVQLLSTPVTQQHETLLTLDTTNHGPYTAVEVVIPFLPGI